VEPLFTAAELVAPIPAPFNHTVTFWQIAFGFTVSRTVTVAVQILKLPFTSVTVKVTVLEPATFAQV
jgi:hypothetical protein